MKLLKKIFVLLACMMIMLGAFLFYGSYTGRHLLEKDIAQLLVREIKLEEPLDQMLRELYLPEGVRAQLIDQVREKKQILIENEEFNTFLDQYSRALLNSIVDDKAELPDINGDFGKLIDQHGKEITSVFDGLLDEDFQQMILDGIKDGLDLRPVYQLIVSSIQAQLTPQQTDLLSLAIKLCQPEFKLIGILCAGGGVILLLLLCHPVLWMLLSGLSMMTAGVGMLTGKLYANQLIGSLVISDEVLQDFIHAELERLQKFGLFYFALGSILTLLWFLFHQIGKRKSS